MPKPSFEDFRKDMDQALEHLRREMEHARAAMEEAMAQARAEMEAARVELENEWTRAREEIDAARAQMEGGWAQRAAKAARQRRGPRKRPGGETAPVKPRPNPSPLEGGAEAPLE